MKRTAFALLTGFGLALVAVLTMGQSRPAATGAIGRYQIVADVRGGALVLDTATGMVKAVTNTRINMRDPNVNVRDEVQRLDVGKTFEQLEPATQ